MADQMAGHRLGLLSKLAFAAAPASGATITIAPHTHLSFRARGSGGS